MKKTIVSAFLLGSFFVSTAAMATAIVSGGQITTAACTLLGEAVTLNLSNNVSGSYSCVEATSTITIAACHSAGSRNTTTVACVNSAAPTDPADWNDASCTAATDNFEITDFRGYRASSQGGRVGAVALGGACTAASVEALVN